MDAKTKAESYSDKARKGIEDAASNSCKRIEKTAEDFRISFDETNKELIETLKKLTINQVLKSCCIVIPAMLVVVAITIFGGWFYKSFGNEKQAAELARQVEKKEFEKWKVEQENEIERRKTEIENELIAQKESIDSLLDYERNEIKREAVEDYKKSNDFVIDGATYVANNFYQYRILETFYQEMPIKDKKDLGLYEWLIDCHKKYKEKYGNKTPREVYNGKG